MCHQAVDLQPEEPATVSHHSEHVSLRERLLRFNVAVLRIVAAACAGLPDSKQVSLKPLHLHVVILFYVL